MRTGCKNILALSLLWVGWVTTLYGQDEAPRPVVKDRPVMYLKPHGGFSYLTFHSDAGEEMDELYFDHLRSGYNAGLEVSFCLTRNLSLGLRGNYFNTRYSEGLFRDTITGVKGILQDDYRVLFMAPRVGYTIITENFRINLGGSIGAAFFTNQGVFLVDTFKADAVSLGLNLEVGLEYMLSPALGVCVEIHRFNSRVVHADFVNYTNIYNYFRQEWDLSRFDASAGLKFYLGKIARQRLIKPRYEEEYIPGRFR